MEIDAETICGIACRAGLWGEPEAFALLRKFRERPASSVEGDAKDSGAAFVEYLLRDRRLSRYQAGCLLQGGRGLRHAAGFLILSPRGEGEWWGRRWDAMHPDSSLRFVLHVFKPGFRETARLLFAKSQLLSAGLAKVHGGMLHGQVLTVVEECPAGVSLGRSWRAGEKLPIDRACSIALDVARTLEDIHAQGGSHGRVRAEEVVVQRTGRAVMQWGRPMEGGNAPAGVDEGTAGQDGESEVEADIRSLGMLLRGMIAGRAGLPAGTAAALGSDQAESNPSLADVTDAPRRLVELIHRMIRPVPGQASLDASAVARELLAYLPPHWSPGPREVASAEDAFLHALPGFEPVGTGETWGWVEETRGEEASAVAVGKVRHSTDRGRGIRTPSAAADQPIRVASPDSSADRQRPGGELQPRSRGTKPVRSAMLRWFVWLPLAGLLACVVGLGVHRLLQPTVRSPLSQRVASAPPAPSEGSTASRGTDPKTTETVVEETRKTDPAPAVDAKPPVKPAVSLPWQSPTSGKPLTLVRIPDGVQGVVWLRPAAILAEPEARAALEALGPAANDHLAALLQSVSVQMQEVEELLIAFTPRDAEPPEVTLNLRLPKPARERLETLLKNSQVNERGLQGTLGAWAAWFPGDAPPWLVVASDATLTQMIEEDRGPILRRQLEVLRRMSDEQWQLYCFFTPSFLAADGDALWSGVLRQLRDPFLRFCGDTAQAVSLGCFVDPDVFFLEARLVYSGSESVTNRVLEMPERLDRLVADAKRGVAEGATADFWQPMAGRFPAMVETVRQWTRVGSDEAGLVMNVALPSLAAKNLFLATELALSDVGSRPPRGEVRPEKGGAGRLDSAAVLASPISLVVRQQSLEAVIQEVALAVREKQPAVEFGIEVRGQDLQLDGITRNQQLRGIRMEDRPLREVLTEVVRRANPQAVETVKMAEQKLVWTVAPQDAGSSTIKVFITTRDAASRNGWQLPEEFLE